MSASTISSVLARKRTEAPVWRGSLDENDRRAKVAMPVGDEQRHALAFIDVYILAMKRWANESKTRGRPHAISHNMIAVAEALMRRCMDFKTGRCTPCIDTIMEKTRFARPTVISLLRKLREEGFMDWVRRTAKTGNAPGEGPPVRQTSNAYFIDFARLPKQVMLYLRQKLRGLFDFERQPASWRGSGPVPPRAMRLAGALASRFAVARTGLASELRARASQISAASPAERAQAMWPDDPEAQRFYEEAMAAPTRQTASSGHSLECLLKERDKKE